MKIVPKQNVNVHEIVDAIRNGATIIYPTETCYGLGCDATNAAPVEKIFDIKQRPKEKSVLMLAHDAALMMRYVQWNEKLEEIATKYWPGALTVVAQAIPDSGLAPGVIAHDGTVAFRITSHQLAAELTEALDRPLVSTSANIAGLPSPYSIEEVHSMFDTASAQPDIVIDAGELPLVTPSTIIKIGIDGNMQILRQGPVII